MISCRLPKRFNPGLSDSRYDARLPGLVARPPPDHATLMTADLAGLWWGLAVGALVLIPSGMRRVRQAYQVTAAPMLKINSAYKSGDYVTVVLLLLPLAERGDPIAQYNLGIMFLQGKGVTKDNAAAVKWLKKAADQGNSDAQSSLAILSGVRI